MYRLSPPRPLIASTPLEILNNGDNKRGLVVFAHHAVPPQEIGVIKQQDGETREERTERLERKERKKRRRIARREAARATAGPPPVLVADEKTLLYRPKEDKH